MFNPARLKVAFQGLVGIRQPYSPGVPLVQAPLSNSSTGIYVDDKHPLAATENIWYSSPNFEPSAFQSWNVSISYVIDDVVNYSGVLYICILATTGGNPATDTTKWSKYYPFQKRLQQKYDQAVSNLFFEVARKKKIQYMGKAILERLQLYRGGGSLHNKVIPQGRFVGFQIFPQQAEGLLVIIEQF